MIVIDASALVAIIIGDRAATVEARLARSNAWNAPVTLEAEILHALRRHWFNGNISSDEVEHAMNAVGDMAITRHPVQPLVHRMWSLRRNVTAYDAAYIALAETLNAPLVTRDARLARSAGHAAVVELIE